MDEKKNAQESSVVPIVERFHDVLYSTHVTKADDTVSQKHVELRKSMMTWTAGTSL